MGPLKRYLRMLSVEERDRVIAATRWKTGDFVADADGSACLVTHAEGIARPVMTSLFYAGNGKTRFVIGCVFDRVVWRYGMPRAVELVKAECARLNRSDAVSVSAMTEGHKVRFSVEVGR